MTITIELTPEEAARLLETADRQGRPPEGVVHSLVRSGLFSAFPALFDQTPISEAAHEALTQRLLEAGLMTNRPTRPLSPPPPPIAVQGLPVSQTLLEERC